MTDYPSTPPMPRDVTDLQAEANRLASQLEAHRRAVGNLPLVRVRPTWGRVLQFPVTVRKFERVFFCQGKGRVARWTAAVRWAWVTVRARRLG